VIRLAVPLLALLVLAKAVHDLASSEPPE
jgi:hypothetical protein